MLEFQRERVPGNRGGGHTTPNADINGWDFFVDTIQFTAIPEPSSGGCCSVDWPFGALLPGAARAASGLVNLAARMTLTGINQLWVADITYIRLRVKFLFLAVILDRFSRKAIGWALDRTLAARVAVTALRRAV